MKETSHLQLLGFCLRCSIICTLISWNGVNSNSFAVKNSVKQDAVIKPGLFCIYIDKLLFNLHGKSISCFIFNGKMFVGALSYADNIVLIVPKALTMVHSWATCDRFADNFSIVFNAKKSVFNI